MSCLPLHPKHTHSDAAAWITARVFKRRSSRPHFAPALRHFDAVLCEHRSDNNGGEKGTSTQGAKTSHPPPRQAWCPCASPAALGRAGAAGPRGSAARPWSHAGAATSPHVTAICASLARPALRGHRLELCRENNSAPSTLFFFFFLPFFTLPASAVFALGDF